MSRNDIPARVLDCFVMSQTGLEPWPFDDGQGDPYWRFGDSPKDYRWRLVVQVTSQHHSSHKTRVPKLYTGLDVKVGDFIASTTDGLALKIIRIDEKTDDSLICIVEDVLRYNTYRDNAGIGNGMFTVPGAAVIFELNESGLPVVAPLPSSGVSPQFYPNLMSRFQDREDAFLLEKTAHGFSVGQIVSADPVANTFRLTSESYPYMIGRVSLVPSPNHFVIEPIQRIVDDLDYLPGEVGDILYADDDVPGGLTLTTSGNPVMVKLRDHTVTVLTSVTANATTSVGAVLSVNGFDHPIGGARRIANLVNAINAQSANTGVTASAVLEPNALESNSALLGSYGEPLFDLDGSAPSATINGVSVSFTSTEDGTYRYGEPFATAYDMATDINAAMLSANGTIVASTNGSNLVLTETAGAAITIVNGQADAQGTYFAGAASASGLALTKEASTGQLARLVAQDARPIDIANKTGTPVEDYGLYSVENGTKAAGLFIEQGIRQASNTVVGNIAARDALAPMLGDQVHVIDKGDGEWGLYIYDGSVWRMIASAETSKVDSDTYTVDVAHSDTETTLGEVGSGCKVGMVTVEVTQAFDGTASLTVGDDDDTDRLAGDDQIDLTSVGTYVVMPSHVFEADATIKVFVASTGSVGAATVTISYQ